MLTIYRIFFTYFSVSFFFSYFSFSFFFSLFAESGKIFIYVNFISSSNIDSDENLENTGKYNEAEKCFSYKDNYKLCYLYTYIYNFIVEISIYG